MVGQDDILRLILALPLAEQLELHRALTELLALAQVAEGRPRHSIVELRGLGKDAWEGLDARIYLDTERDSWSS